MTTTTAATTTGPPVDWRRASLGDLLRGLASSDPLDAVPRLTVLAVLTAMGTPWGLVAVPVAALIVFEPRRYRHPLVWLGAAAVLAARHLPEWEGVDNHQWLLVYWCLALAVTFLCADPRRALGRQGAVLVGLVFGLAVVWKVVSGEYVDGSFFHHSLLADPRFEPVARLAGGLSERAYDANQAALGGLQAGVTTVADLATSSRLQVVALTMTGWGLLVEALIAAAFLAPIRWAIWRLRHATVVAFCVTTYLVVPVVLFGWLVAMMGYATTTGAERSARRWYAGLFAFLLVWAPVWRLVTGVPA